MKVDASKISIALVIAGLIVRSAGGYFITQSQIEYYGVEGLYMSIPCIRINGGTHEGFNRLRLSRHVSVVS